jgi:hypothetical protein
MTIPVRPDARFAARLAAVDKINVTGLENHLRRHFSGVVRFDTAAKAMYANDASNDRQVLIEVVVRRHSTTWWRPCGVAMFITRISRLPSFASRTVK